MSIPQSKGKEVTVHSVKIFYVRAGTAQEIHCLNE